MPMFVGVAEERVTNSYGPHSCALLLNPMDVVPGLVPHQHTTHIYMGDVQQ